MSLNALNPWLYSRLLIADPNAEIVSEGEPATFAKPSQKAGYTGRHSFVSVIGWGECYRMNCPFCGDTKQRLFFCHLAGATVRVKKSNVRVSVRVCVCHNEHCNAECPEFLTWLYGMQLHTGPVLVLDERQQPSVTTAYKNLFSTVADVVPTKCYPLLSEETPAKVLDYIRDRKFDPHELQEKWAVGFCKAGSVYIDNKEPDPEKQRKELFDDRIIIPIHMGRRQVGWQARLPYDDVPEGKPKYLTSPNMSKSLVLFNFDKASLHSVPVLVEGVFDVFRLGNRAICPFGKTLSTFQIQALQLAFGQYGGMLVLLDPDAAKDSDKVVDKLKATEAFPRGVVAVPLPDKRDPANLPRAYLDSLLEYYSGYLYPVPKLEPVDMKPEEMFAGFSELTDGE